MTDFEKLGLFYLGRRRDAATRTTLDDLVLYDSRDLVTHALCVGMTGSGKTGLGVTLVEEAAIDAVPVLAIDPKGDLGNLLLTFPSLSAEEFQPWVNGDDARRAGMTVEAFAAQQAATWSAGVAAWGQDGARIQRLRSAADFAIFTPGSRAGRPVSISSSFAAPPPGSRRRCRRAGRARRRDGDERAGPRGGRRRTSQPRAQPDYVDPDLLDGLAGAAGGFDRQGDGPAALRARQARVPHAQRARGRTDALRDAVDALLSARPALARADPRAPGGRSGEAAARNGPVTPISLATPSALASPGSVATPDDLDNVSAPAAVDSLATPQEFGTPQTLGTAGDRRPVLPPGIREVFEQVVIRPKRGHVDVQFVALAWVPDGGVS